MSHIVVHPRILMVDNDKRAIEALTALLSKGTPQRLCRRRRHRRHESSVTVQSVRKPIRHHIARHVARGLAGTRHLQTYTPHQQ